MEWQMPLPESKPGHRMVLRMSTERPMMADALLFGRSETVPLFGPPGAFVWVEHRRIKEETR